MNIEQAKAIPLAEILETIGYNPATKRKQEAVYFSPFRNEKTPSFNLHMVKNIWFDFGENIGGNTVDFAVAYLKSQNNESSLSCALRWITNITRGMPVSVCLPKFDTIREEPKLVVKQVCNVKHRALLSYLTKRGITGSTEAFGLKEVRVFNPESGKEFFALGFPNEENGYELRNTYFKGCVGAKAVSFIRGKRIKPAGIHIFEGSFDYLSAITYRNIAQFEEDTIILHSLSCLQQALPYIRGYGYREVYTWLDNDRAGKKGLKTLEDFFLTEESLKHRQMNGLYLSHKDVNEWHMHRLKLSF